MFRSDGWRFVLRVLHLVLENEKLVLDVAEALWGRLALGRVAHGRHGCGVLWRRFSTRIFSVDSAPDQIVAKARVQAMIMKVNWFT